MMGYFRLDLGPSQRDTQREHERGDAGFVPGAYGSAEGERS
jgi:hypothetical protein